MLSSQSKRAVLEVVTISTLLFLLVALPSWSQNEAHVYSSGAIKYSANTRVGQFDNGTYYIQVVRGDGTLATVYRSTDADVIINYAINIGNGGSVFIAYAGHDYEIDNSIDMKNNVTLILDNNVRLNHVGANGRSVRFSGVENAHLLGLGRATITGKGIDVLYSTSCSIENIEVKDTTLDWLNVVHSDNNTFQDLYGHNYALNSPYPWHGLHVMGANGNKFINVVSDGEHGAQTRSALVLGGSEGPSVNNQIIGGEFKNSLLDNGIYVGSWEYPVENNTFTGFVVSGCSAAGHSGIKVRPGSYNTFTGFLSAYNYNGIEVGTNYNSGVYAYGNSTGNIFEGVIRNSINTGLVLTVDGDNLAVRDNIFHLIITNSGSNGVWISHDKASSTIERNRFDLVSSSNYRDGINIQIETAGARVSRNYFSATCTNNGRYGVILRGSQANYITDNRLDVVAENNSAGNISDSGTRTRINGFGKEAAGVGNSPAAAFWDVGDIVENTDDNTVWIKTSDGAMRKISL
jgi:hypothetical protein